MTRDIRCGDQVFHRPTRETWLVAWCDGERLQWCGWPPGTVPAAECLIVDKATDTYHASLVAEILRPETKDDHMRRMVRRLYGAAVA